MRTIAVASQKGGCGKTTTSINLAAALAHVGKQVLIVDLDPQACTTGALDGGPRAARTTVYYPLINTQVPLSEVTVHTSVERLDLVPSNVAVAGAELQLMGVSGRELRLARALATVRNQYHVCVIDCPPSLGALTLNALVACTDVIVPVNVDSYALESTKRLLETVSIIRRRFHSQSAGNLRVLLTNVEDRTVLGRRVQQQMRQLFNDLVFDTVIHRTVTLAEALAAGKAALTYAPTSAGAQEYLSLAQELLASEPGPDPEAVLATVGTADQEPPSMSAAVAVPFPDLFTAKSIFAGSPTRELRDSSGPEEPSIPESIAPAAPVGRANEPMMSHAGDATAVAPHVEFSNPQASRLMSPAAQRRQIASYATFGVCWVAALIAIIVGMLVNKAPIVRNVNITTLEDTAVSITLPASDANGDDLTYTIVDGPSHGHLTGTPPNLVYTPAPNYNGPDSFTFTCSDGKLESEQATVSILLTPVNDAPVANSRFLDAASNKPLSLVLEASDVEGDPITFSIGEQPKHGKLVLHAQFARNGQLVYTPDPKFSGPDQFTFNVTDGQAEASLATISLNVVHVNSQPVAEAVGLTTDEDTPVSITLKGSDQDDDALTYRIVKGPSHGRLSGMPPQVTYTPLLDYNGPDSFTFVASDGKIDSEPATVSLFMSAVDDPPVASAQSVTVEDDKSVSLALAGSDADGDPLTFSIGEPPKHGTLEFGSEFARDGKLVYTPKPPFTGLDSFTFKVSDGTQDSPLSTVSLNVVHVNRPPIAGDLSLTIKEDMPLPITLEASDPENSPLTYVIVTEPAHGVLRGAAPNLEYTPSANFHGADAFTYSVSDGQGGTVTATVAITVEPVNDPPRIISEPVIGAAVGRQYVYAVKAEDPDGDTLTYSLLDSPLNMTINERSGLIEWTPMDAQIGTFQAKIQVTDNHGASSADSQSFRINVGIPTPQKVTLTIADGYDQKSQKKLSEMGEVRRVQESDDDACATPAGFYTVYEFSKVKVPAGAKITSLVIYIRHFEESQFPMGKLEWRIGTGWPESPTSWVSLSPTVFLGQKNNGTVAWDFTSALDSAEKINSLQLVVKNNCTTAGQTTFVDNVYIVAEWR